MYPKIEEIVKVLRGCECCNDETFMACPTNMPGISWCREELMLIAADIVEQLQQELIDERYRHDRLQDFCVAQGEELAEYKRRLRAVIALLNGDENLVVTGLPEEANIQCK